jgi:hypothetical protein
LSGENSKKKDYCASLLHHYGLSKQVQESHYLGTCTGIFAVHFNLTLREIERVFAIMTIYYGALPKNQITFELLITLLSVLKVKRPSIYYLLSKGNISADEFYRQSALDLMKVSGENFSPHWAKDFLDYCIMSDSEFESATTSGDGTKPARSGLAQMEGRVRMNRKIIIPFLCSQLDRFSLQPG